MILSCGEDREYRVRYLRLTIVEIPYEVEPCISGLRVFGIGNGKQSQKPVEYQAKKSADGSGSACVRSRRRLMQSAIIFCGDMKKINYITAIRFTGMWKICVKGKTGMIEKRIGALVKGQEYFVRVDSYNENGITHGDHNSLFRVKKWSVYKMQMLL